MYLCRTLGELLRMHSGCFCYRSNNVWFWKEQGLVSFAEMKCQKCKHFGAHNTPLPIICVRERFHRPARFDLFTLTSGFRIFRTWGVQMTSFGHRHKLIQPIKQAYGNFSSALSTSRVKAPSNLSSLPLLATVLDPNCSKTLVSCVSKAC